MRGMGFALGRGIINGCPVVASHVSKVVWVDLGGIPY
jgi:hypothetical protein